MDNKIEIPRVLEEMRHDLPKIKELVKRLQNGEIFIERAMATNSVVKAQEGVELFVKLAKDLNKIMEHALFMHEVLCTGRTTLINRQGRPVNVIEYPAKETVLVDLFTLESIQKLKEVFGEDVDLDIVE